MEPPFGPDECLRRLCRICGKEMESRFDSDGEVRIYDFDCKRCGTTVRLFEEIMTEMRQTFKDDGRILEPLTREEEAKQASEINVDEDFFKEFPNNIRKWKERWEINLKRSMLDDEEAKKLK